MGRCGKSSKSSGSSGSSGSSSIVLGEGCFGREMVMSHVETIGWRDDVSCIEHTAKHLLHERMVLTCLLGQFFGTKWTARCLQALEDILSLRGEGCASPEEGGD